MPLTATTVAAATAAPMHPALRWQPLGGAGQHRRTEDGNTVCGLTGPLTLADSSEEYCGRGCWSRACSMRRGPETWR